MIANWILHTFRNSTIQMLGSPRDFHNEIATFIQLIPVVNDKFEFPRDLGRYNNTRLRKSEVEFPRGFAYALTKFTLCTATLFYPFTDSDRKEINEQAVINSVKEFILGMIFSHENSNFIVFIFESTELAYATCDEITRRIRFESVSSIGLLALSSRSEMRLLCVTCPKPLNNPLGNLGISSTDIKKLQKQVNILNRDLHGNLVSVFKVMINPTVSKTRTCSLLKIIDLYSPNAPCALDTPSQRLNFTPFEGKHGKIFGELFIGLPVSVSAVKSYFRTTK